MTDRGLLRLSAERRRAELERVARATADDRAYCRRRNAFAATGALLWFTGVVILGGAFHTTSLELGSVLLLLGPMVGSFGPIIVAYVFWVTSGEVR